jgi:hypothetical protein
MKQKKAKRKNSSRKRLKRLSFYPLKTEEAIKLILQVKPEDVRIKT